MEVSESIHRTKPSQYSHITSNLQRYREIESIGEGTYGVVIRSVHKATGTLVAIKEFKDSKDKERVCATSTHTFAG